MANSVSISAKLPRTNTTSGRSLWYQADQGLRGVLGNIQMFIDNLDGNVVLEVMGEALKPTLELAKFYAPEDTGTLRSSGYVNISKRKGSPRVEIGFNKRGEAPYAIFVHEMTQIRHAHPTQAKYLQRALDEDQGNIYNRLVIGLKARTGLS